MSEGRYIHQVVSFAFAAFLLTVSATGASAQGFFSFFWGGGSREVVSFSQSVPPHQIIVSFGDRKLYWVYKRGEAISYPIAVPREKSRWQGVSVISDKRVNPSWTPTAEMRRENPTLPAYMPGGHPRNPLGVRALYLGASMYRIHGTDAPWTIGDAVSKGCIRMYNEDVLDLYPRVPVGTRVTVTWQRYT
jgi:lipoprotein-anchoring transpeptidase ErfK/SrfK